MIIPQLCWWWWCQLGPHCHIPSAWPTTEQSSSSSLPALFLAASNIPNDPLCQAFNSSQTKFRFKLRVTLPEHTWIVPEFVSFLSEIFLSFQNEIFIIFKILHLTDMNNQLICLTGRVSLMMRIFPVELRHCVSPPTGIRQSALKIQINSIR